MHNFLEKKLTTYRSPALIPKPKDWAEHISISGFYFLSLASGYTPEKTLLDFLAAGPPPVYIGFGSIVVDDPEAMTRLIFDAVKLAGIRALVSQGWADLVPMRWASLMKSSCLEMYRMIGSSNTSQR